jgi:methylase of polypeptide subunit release factors
MTEAAPFLLEESDADLAGLREALAGIGRTGYSEAAVRERLGLADITDLNWRHLPMYRDERLARRDPLSLAIDLFLLQGALDRGETERLLPSGAREVLVRTGLLDIGAAGCARARASLFPVGGRLIFSDHAWPELPHPGFAEVPYEQVMAVGLDSRHLAHATIRRPMEAALDLCTGSGIHALLAAAQARRVCAVDINPRAIRCTRFNALALGIDNLEARQGDLFAPVSGERFDLITANPPFVPSPVNALRFRDGGASGEDVQTRIVAGLPHHLATRGMAQMVTEIGEREGESIAGRVRQWLNGAAMDIHILRVGTHTAAQYAVGHAKGADFGEFLQATGQWARNLREQGYARVVSVLISFQWTAEGCEPWERMDESRAPQRAAGAEIEEIFAVERLVRDPEFGRRLKGKRLRAAGPIARFDAGVLGAPIPPKAKATRLGQALTMECELDAAERQLLDGLGTAVDAPAGAEETIRSLLRKRLIAMES